MKKPLWAKRREQIDNRQHEILCFQFAGELDFYSSQDNKFLSANKYYLYKRLELKKIDSASNKKSVR